MKTKNAQEIIDEVIEDLKKIKKDTKKILKDIKND